ncbi:MAG: CoA transferase [Acidimicrobiales bacterium]
MDAAINPFFAARTRAEAVRELQEHRRPAGQVLNLAETLHSPQLEARTAVPDGLGSRARLPGPPFRLNGRHPSRARPSARRPPGGPVPMSSAGTDNTDGRVRRPGGIDLRGVRVLEFSVAWAGPMAGRWLASSAPTSSLEHPTSRGLSVGENMKADPAWRRGDLPGPALRNGVFPDNDPGEHWWNRLGYFNKINRTAFAVHDIMFGRA